MEAPPTLTIRFEGGECFYAILGVEKDASATEIRRAYHKLALQFHPDRVQGDDAARAFAKNEFQTLGRIYETLSIEEKRRFYDETGSIEHDDFLSSSEDKNWDEYWRLLFKKVTADDIENYAKSFKGSELEAADVKKAYADHEGDMEAIINSVVLSSWDDENRFRVIIDAAIKAGEVPTFDAYEAGSKKKSKRSTAAARRRREKEDQEEAKEAEELAQKLGLRAGGKRSDEDSLKQMILQNKGKSEARFSSVIANLEAKYGSKKEAKKAGGRKGTKDEGANEPTEEEFLALQKKLERGKAEQQEGGEKERSQKKRRISKEEDPHDNDTNEPTEEEFEQARRRLEQRKRDAAATQRRSPTKRRAGEIAQSHQRGMRKQTDDGCPYRGWSLYFPFEAFSPEDMAFRATLIDGFINYLSPITTPAQKEAIRRMRSLTLDYSLLVKELDEKIKNIFMPALLGEPELCIGSVGVAVFEVVYEGVSEQQASKHKINVRFAHYDKVTAIKKIKSNYIGKFTCVRGTIVRVGNIKPIVRQMDFHCGRCGSTMTIIFEDGKFHAPEKCSTTHCRGRAFDPIRSSAVTVDWQKIRVQELMATGNDAGRVPRTIECELTDDMVDTGVPGDVVTVAGIVKVTNPDLEKPGRGSKQQKEKAMFVIYLDANVVENCKQMDKLEAVDFSMVDLQMITDIASQDNLFSLIVNSLCPTIFGHQLVKAGLMLALFAGTRRGHDKDTLPIRSDSHVLVVGDPGLGKSQLLQAVSNVAPRGVYVCGSYSSSSGLTVTLFKEKGSGDYALEAGALILGDQGVCCIDEFDKMPNEHQSLLEAMEQQSISIAKAGIVCSLPARTAVIAAANPVGGHYNRAKTVAENLKMSEAVLSRFDLVFILLDKPDEQRDEMISDHVMALHSVQKKVHRKRKKVEGEEDTGKRKTLLQRLDPSLIPADTLIPPLLVRKYIAYAKKYVSPRLSTEASIVLKNFYISLRKKHRSSDSTPITTRQLESLIRLSEAKAKSELRDIVTEEDALDVVELMQSSLFDLFEDEYGNLDFRRTTGVSKSGQVKAFVQALSKIATKESNSVFSKAELNRVMGDINLRLDISFDDFIDRLNIQGFLLKSGPNAYKLVAA